MHADRWPKPEPDEWIDLRQVAVLAGETPAQILIWVAQRKLSRPRVRNVSPPDSPRKKWVRHWQRRAVDRELSVVRFRLYG